MSVFRTNVIVFISDVIMCFTSDWPISWRMWETNWPNICVDQGQFSDPEFFLSAAHIQGKMSNLQIKILIQYTLPQAWIIAFSVIGIKKCKEKRFHGQSFIIWNYKWKHFFQDIGGSCMRCMRISFYLFFLQD
jgi:hypothetical protein